MNEKIDDMNKLNGKFYRDSEHFKDLKEGRYKEFELNWEINNRVQVIEEEI